MKHIFSHRKIAIIAVVGILAIVGMLLVAVGYYPILIVDGHVVFARTFFQNVRAASIYEAHLKEIYPDSVTSTPQSEIEASVLSNLVDEAVVSDGFHREVGRDADTLVAEKLQNFSQTNDFGQTTQALYGLSLEAFRREVLVPQAESDILKGRLFLQGDSIEDWMVSARHAARVTVLSPKFRWDGEKIVANQ